MLGVKKEAIETQHVDGWIGPAPHIVTNLPGPNATAMIARDQAYSSPSYTRDVPLVVKRGAGSVIEDVDGNRFLDFAAGIAVCATGHCHPKVIAAIEEQTRNLIHICGSDFYYPPMVEVMEKLANIAPGPAKKRVFLTNSGTEAVEAAIKLARHKSNRKWIISFFGAFHGRTMGALSLTCSKVRQKEKFGPLVPMVAHAPYGDIDFIENQIFKRQASPHEVAAIFVEAVQGEGGYILPPPNFLADLRALCDRHGIFLVCDEIQSGCGRTGKWFAFEHYGIIPDIITVAKGIASGMPLGAVIAREDIMDWPPGAQGSTFGGNPVCCAAALATLELVETHFMPNAATLGPKVVRSLESICAERRIVGNARGLGLMCAVDVMSKKTGKPDPKLREKIIRGAFDRGLVVLPCGDNAIRFCPPLCINETQLDVGLRLFDETLASLA